MPKYNAIINFAGNNKKMPNVPANVEGNYISGDYTIRIDFDINDYRSDTGQPSDGTITFYLLNGKGEKIARFLAANAVDISDGGVRFILNVGGSE